MKEAKLKGYTLYYFNYMTFQKRKKKIEKDSKKVSGCQGFEVGEVGWIDGAW